MLAAASLLAACGGGGGGGGSDAPGVPGTNPTPTPSSATLQSANAGDDAALAIGLAEQTLMVAQLAGDEMRAQAARGVAGASGIACDGEGTRDVSVDDVDGSGSFNVGDRLHLSFDGCRSTMFEGLLNGKLVIDVVAPTLSPAAAAWAAEVAPVGELGVLRDGETSAWLLGGGMHVESRMDLDGVVVRADSSGSDTPAWREQGASSTERMFDLQLGKTLSYVDAKGRVDISYTLDSDTLGGEVSVSTGSNGITGWIGRLPDAGELRVSGKGQLILRPQSADGSTSANVGFDANGDGVVETSDPVRWVDLAAGFLWWAQGLVPLSDHGTAYPIPPTGFPQPLRYGIGAIDALPLKPVLEWTFASPLDAASVPRMVLERQAATPALPWSRADDDWGSSSVPLQVTPNGARLTLALEAGEQLQPGRKYLLRMLPAAAGNPTQLVELRDTRGNVIALTDDDVYTARDSFGAAARFTPLPPSLLPAGDLSVDADASFDFTQAIASYHWEQVGTGPRLVIDAPSSSLTAIRPESPVTGDGEATLQLTVTNAAGEKDVALLPVKLLAPRSSQTQQLYFRSSPGSKVGGGDTRVITAGDGASFTVNRPSPDQLEVVVVEAGNAQTWTWRFTVPGGNVPIARSYVDADTDFHDTDFAHTPAPGNSRTDLRQITFDAGGNVTSLDVDFFHDTGGVFGSVSGSLRFNSAAPVRP